MAHREVQLGHFAFQTLDPLAQLRQFSALWLRVLRSAWRRPSWCRRR
jgi:hypothetical protein